MMGVLPRTKLLKKVKNMKHAVNKFIADIMYGRPRYEDKGAGEHNASVLQNAMVRPIFFDCSCVLYRLMYSKHKKYSKMADGDSKKLIHILCCAFMKDIADACAQFRCAPVLCFDSSISYREQQVYPDYKEGRTKKKKLEDTMKEMLVVKPDVIAELQKFYAPDYNIQTFCVRGYEGDDILASFILGLKQCDLMQQPAFKGHVVVASNDHDIHQLVIEGVHFADVSTGVMATADQIERHTGIHPSFVVASKTIGGCKSDDVPNVPSCGKVTVKEILSSNGNTDKIKLTKARNNLQSEEGLNILRRNLKLVRLPFEGNPPMPPLRLSKKIWPTAGLPDTVVEFLAMEYGRKMVELVPPFPDVSAPLPAASMVPRCKSKRRGN